MFRKTDGERRPPRPAPRKKDADPRVAGAGDEEAWEAFVEVQMRETERMIAKGAPLVTRRRPRSR